MAIMNGITSREVGFKHSYYDDATNSNLQRATLTLNNVHTLTTYDLRQELKSRGHSFENYDGPTAINYEFLLKHMVNILQREKEEFEQKHMKELERQIKCGSSIPVHSGSDVFNEDVDGLSADLQEKLKRVKARRKAEALERSRQRQMDKDYFTSKKEANISPSIMLTNDYKNINEIEDKDCVDGKNKKDVLDSTYSQNKKEAKDHHSEVEEDPFRRRFRSKIGGKCA